MPPSRPIPAARRGSFATTYAVSALGFVALAALAIDVTLIRLARSETQAIADTASHTALLRLRATGDRDHATAIAKAVVEENEVVGGPAVMQDIKFGQWVDGAFTEDAGAANAVQVTVSSDAQLTFATMWQSDVAVQEVSTAAARTLQTIVVLDITNSWSPLDFEDARAGAVEVFDQLTATAGPDDYIGMVTFTGQFGIEQTPLTLAQEAEVLGVRADWSDLRTASKAGTGYGRNCTLHSGGRENDFSSPLNGCYPNMWREYRDEYGTDHAVGIDMAREMFAAMTDPSAYRAMIILTDGQPNGTGPGSKRVDDGYEETRWTYKTAGGQRGANEVITASLASTQAAWDDDEIHTWVVSYKVSANWLDDLATGDGTFLVAHSSEDLVPIFADIAESLPTMVVK